MPYPEAESHPHQSLKGCWRVLPAHVAEWLEHDALSGRGSHISLGTSAYQRIISINSYAYD